MITTAFVLGAGRGTRLLPLTANTPKPLLPVRGKPMICHVFDSLLDAGVQQFIVNTHHCAEAYATAFPDASWRGAKITFVHEPVLLDTGGGLKNIEPLLRETDTSVLVHNGDIFASLALKKLVAAHEADATAGATLLLRETGDGLRNVQFLEDAPEAQNRGEISRKGAVLDMRGRLGATAGKLTLFTGVYCVRREFFRFLETGKIESVVEGFLRQIAANSASRTGGIRALLDDSGFWQDLGTPAEYHAANTLSVCPTAK